MMVAKLWKLEAIELYTSNEWIVWYVNYNSIKLFKENNIVI